MDQDIGRFFILSIFEGKHKPGNLEKGYSGAYMTDELLKILEDAAKEQFPSVYTLFKRFPSFYSQRKSKNQWNLNQMFVTVAGHITNYSGSEDDFVSLNFHVDDNGRLENITMEDME